MKKHKHEAGHMTKMATMPIFSKTLLSRNQWPNFDKKYYEAAKTWGGGGVIIFCSNDNPWLTLTYSMARSNCNLSFYIGKCDNDGLFGNHCIMWAGIWFIYSKLND